MAKDKTMPEAGIGAGAPENGTPDAPEAPDAPDAAEAPDAPEAAEAPRALPAAENPTAEVQPLSTGVSDSDLYFVASPIKHDGKDYAVGDPIRLPEATAHRLAGYLEPKA